MGRNLQTPIQLQISSHLEIPSSHQSREADQPLPSEPIEAQTMSRTKQGIIHGRLLEKSYVMKDPFTPDKDKFLILGSHCSLCCKHVCVGTDCSLFYSKRFCLPCVKLHLKEFPLEIKQDLEKKTHSKSQSSKKPDSKDSKKS